MSIWIKDNQFYLLRGHRSWKRTSFWKGRTWEGWGWRGYRLGSRSNTGPEPTLLPAEYCVRRERRSWNVLASVHAITAWRCSERMQIKTTMNHQRLTPAGKKSVKQNVVWPEVTNVVEAAGSICAPHDLETERRLQVSDLQQHQRQVLNEQQRIHQRNCVSHNAPVVALLGLQHPHAVKKPIRRYEEEDQRQEQATEDEEAWQAGSGRADKQRPRGDEEDEEFEGQGNVKALTWRPTWLQCFPPQERGEQQEGQRSEESQEPQGGAQRWAQVPPALWLQRILKVLPDLCQVLVWDAVHRGPSDHCGGLAPVIVLVMAEQRTAADTEELRQQGTQHCTSHPPCRLLWATLHPAVTPVGPGHPPVFPHGQRCRDFFDDTCPSFPWH